MKILTVPNPLLRQKSKPVKKIDESVRRLTSEMATFLLQNDHAVGLSAPQTGSLLRLFAVKNSRIKRVTIFINPKIIFSSEKTLLDIKPKEKFLLEGCLSIPGVYAFINRPEKIRIKYLDENGKSRFLTASPPFSVYLQHEYDHLEGILFIDRAVTQKERLYRMDKDGSLEEI